MKKLTFNFAVATLNVIMQFKRVLYFITGGAGGLASGGIGGALIGAQAGANRGKSKLNYEK